jgi:hypothetical protein
VAPGALVLESWGALGSKSSAPHHTPPSMPFDLQIFPRGATLSDNVPSEELKGRLATWYLGKSGS